MCRSLSPLQSNTKCLPPNTCWELQQACKQNDGLLCTGCSLVPLWVTPKHQEKETEGESSGEGKEEDARAACQTCRWDCLFPRTSWMTTVWEETYRSTRSSPSIRLCTARLLL